MMPKIRSSLRKTMATQIPKPSSTPEIGLPSDGEDATDFISTIGTAVGPLLLLFGELTTMQFLSVSMSWADDILLAMCPIGIITIGGSTIRISGYRWSKAIIGR